MSNRRFIGKRQLEAVSKYSYCPYCIKECKEKDVNYQDVLKPIHIYKMLDSIKKDDGTYRGFVDEIYFCERCNRELSVEVFRLAYTCRADGSRWNEPPRRTNNVQRTIAE